MILTLHIGPDIWTASRLQEMLHHKRGQLARHGILVPRGAGGNNHSRLFMAATEPDRPDVLRANRGFSTPEAQARLRAETAQALKDEAAAANPAQMILTAHQLAGLTEVSELERLRDMLSPLSDDIRIVAHVDEPARQLARHYAAQVLEGRTRGLEAELELAAGIIAGRDVGLPGRWWDVARAAALPNDPGTGRYSATQAPPAWLDYAALVRHWEGVFGTGRVALRSPDTDQLCTRGGIGELHAAFGIEPVIGKAERCDPPVFPSDAWLARARQMNALLFQVQEVEGLTLPRQLCRTIVEDTRTGGAPVSPGALAPISRLFAPDMLELLANHPGLTQPGMTPDPAQPLYAEAPAGQGYRPSAYLLSQYWRIRKLKAEATKAEAAARKAAEAPKAELSPVASKLLSDRAALNFESLQSSPFRPHNRLGRLKEDHAEAPYLAADHHPPAEGHSGNVIVGCMKNEAPYILEWIAYHRAVGFDSFLIYTNDCTDGTDAILKRLDAMGLLHHRDNDGWQGNSPQQWALDAALEEEVIRTADWVAHIDVDEFVNIRCGNGTLADLYAAMPAATNIAMTWRLFGHNGVTRLSEDFVIEQFDTAAPKYCPKPHTAWGFKTLFRNIGAYRKLSCHRPNKLVKDLADEVRWFNGSGQEMTREVLRNGWRNSKRSIGYDLVQLNHYALRSAESYLIKRQRGRALHVDRSIGLNYWIRMDWSDHRDLTIKRNLPRLRAEMDRLLQDAELRRLHEAGQAWHRAKAEELHAEPEFADLYRQALEVKLTPTERVAYALALEVDN
ncbi:glycosyltransferase family 2 protein [Pseudooceanicola sp. 502str34]